MASLELGLEEITISAYNFGNKGLASKFLRIKDLRSARTVVRSLRWAGFSRFGNFGFAGEGTSFTPEGTKEHGGTVRGVSRFGNGAVELSCLDWELLVGRWGMVPLLLREFSQ